jgi:hypothetical protein
LLTYKDGSRKHITREERDSLVLSRQAKPTASGNYFYTGQPIVLHSLPELVILKDSLNMPSSAIRAYLPGLFKIEHPTTKRKRMEWLETPERMHVRLEQQGVLG